VEKQAMTIDMDQGARRWLHKTARQHYWRVASYIDLDDLVQDGYLTWHRVVTKYADVESRAQLMALFKRVYNMHLHDLANSRSRSVPEVLHCDMVADGVGEDATWEKLVAVFDTDFLFYAEAPKPIRDLLAAVLSDRGVNKLRAEQRVRVDEPAPDRIRVKRRDNVGPRLSLNDRLCALMGCDPALVDLKTTLRNYLTGVSDQYSASV
jgi:DNA-directed RNA polymerase specialized sigma24 family protein